MAKAKTVGDKLLLKAGMTAATINAPAHLDSIADLPRTQRAGEADAVLVFATKARDLEKVPDRLKSGARLWVCYPKAGKLDTDLSRDTLWPLMEKRGWEGVRLVALDETWSGMAFRRKER
jgi:hypothetical protein